MKAVSCVVADRIYIAADLEGMDIPSRFLRIMEKFIGDGENFDDAADQMSALLKEVVELAKKDSKHRNLFDDYIDAVREDTRRNLDGASACILG
jgi:vacuolar-type H+-ATPase subunit D/Vma8